MSPLVLIIQWEDIEQSKETGMSWLERDHSGLWGRSAHRKHSYEQKLHLECLLEVWLHTYFMLCSEKKKIENTHNVGGGAEKWYQNTTVLNFILY